MFIVRFEPDPCPLVATVTTLGASCGAILTSTPPIMGQPMTVDLISSSPSAPAFIFRSGNAAVGAPIQFEGCDVFIDWSFWMVYPMVTDSAGTASATVIVPNDSVRCGLQFVLQGIVVDPAAGPLSIGAISNALIETMGS